METIKFIPNYDKIRLPGNVKKLNRQASLIISNINFILEMIIRNTLNFNKPTSVDEIYDSLWVQQNDPAGKSDLDMDEETIRYICDSMCSAKGILLKFRNNNKNYYKLKFQDDKYSHPNGL
jgi:hypothetical protein